MLRVFIVCILLFLGKYADCQQTQKDSLLNELTRGSSNPKARVDVLNELSFIDYDNDVEQGFIYARQALEIAKTSQYKPGERLAQTLLGYYYHAKGDFNKALIDYKAAANLSPEPDIYLGYNYILTGNLYRSKSFFDSSLYYYNQGIGLLKKLNDTRFLPYGYRSLGSLQVQLWKNAQAEENFQNAFKIYRSLDNEDGMVKVDFALGELYKNLAEFEKAERSVNDGCVAAEKLGDNYLQTRCLIYKGEIKYKLGEFQEALHILLDVIQRLKGKDDPETLSRVYSDLGDVYEAISQNDFAMRYTLEALEIVENLGMKHEIGKLYCSVAWIYKNQQNYAFAFEFLNKSIKIREEIKDENGLGQCYNVMGIIYFQQKRFKEAVEWLEKSLTARSHVGNREGISACLYNLGLVYEAKKEYDQALKYQMKALNAEKKTGNIFNIGLGYSSVGSLFTYLKKYDSAKYYLKIADDIGIKTGSFELQMENALYWSEYYEYTGDTKTALEWHKKYSALNDTVYHATKATKLAEMQALYQTEQKDKEITLLNQEKTIQSNQLQLQKARINLQNYVILFGVIALVLISLLTYKSFTYNKDIKQAHLEILEQKEELMAQSRELQEANRTIAENNKELEAKIEQRTFALREAYRELDTFFYRASHDFRRPLTTFLGLAEVAKITVADSNARELFEKVRETAINLDKMLFKLQSISDLGSQQLVYGEVDVADIFYSLLEQYRNELEAKKIKTFSSFVLPLKFYSYPTMIFLILDNLIENSIMFCRYEGASISLRASETDTCIMLEIEDNGDGIEEKYQEHIFEMYFRGNDRSKGNGLGLYIVRKAVDKLNGVVSFRSARDRGTSFTVTFPLSLASDSRGVVRSTVKDALVI